MAPLLGFAAVALGIWAIFYAVHANQPRVFARQAARFGLQARGRTLSGRGLEVALATEGMGRSQSDVLTYTLTLPGCPPHLKLQVEGAGSGAKFAAGEQELETGDVDFDDLVWVESQSSEEALAYLTEAHRTAFTEAFWYLPEARLENGRFAGRQPWRGEGSLGEVLARCVQLCNDLEAPRTKRQPRGWVNSWQRRYHAAWALVLAMAFTVPAGTLKYLGESTPSLAVLTGGLLFLVSAVSLTAGAPGAAARLRHLVRLLQIGSVVGAAVLAPQLGDGGLIFAALVGVWCYALERWRHALFRVR